MSKILVIVESPGKIKKINEYLGSDYIVKASFGHVLDLDKKTLSIDIENNFKPYYIVSSDKKKVVKELTDLAKTSKEVILAADEDREGEAIAGSLKDVLKLDNPKRIVFHEITKKAILNAIDNPRVLDQNLINAQQTRRLLDRLVGYKISPILWAYKIGNSAGRVQSVVVRIIVDKEKEISDAISEPFFKTCGEFVFDETKINSVLNYEFKKLDDGKKILASINKDSIFKIISVDNKKSIRKPSPPFITSTLQQEASTKLGFSVKRTMDVAQKLYEAGLITYMRTDSTNLSQDALDECKKYIIKKYGEEYSDVKTYTAKNKGAQEAHEAIRPTHIKKDCLEESYEKDCQKLYLLIWKRTIASQMANAKINIQTIKIDIEKLNKSLLIINNKQYNFISSLENVEFPGFLIVYDNTNDDDDTVKGKINIKENDIVTFNKIKISEEYTKLPLRYNEAGLIKYLEKNGIGRPSTYASIINKIIEKKYVEIKNIDGIKKNSLNIELSNKFKIKETTKEIIIGKENKKLVSTECGNNIVSFLLTNFKPIMDIKFTADFEEFLDKIAIGKANWINILNQFYQLFNPICESLSKEVKTNPSILDTDNLFGIDPKTGVEIYTGSGKYGPFIKKKENDVWKYASIKNVSDLNIDLAIELLKYPVLIGKINKTHVNLYKGEFGFYIKYNNKNYSIKNIDEKDINIEHVKKIIEIGATNTVDKFAIQTFNVKDKVINIKVGQYGPFIQIVKGKNIPLPKNIDPETITIEEVLSIIAQKNGTSKK